MSQAKSYYRLCKPGIVYANLLTTIAGYLLASQLDIKLSSFSGVIIGFTFIVAAACIVNNLYDRDIDIKMERTKNRPSVTGAVPLINGAIMAAVLVLIGTFMLLIMDNVLTMMIGLLGFSVYTTAYTISKRRTYHSTLIGSISGATPIVGGYVAYSGRIDAAAIVIGLMMLVWQMPHFYAIAIYRDADYRSAGIPSMPITIGKRATAYWMLFYTLVFALLAMLLYRYAPVSIVYLLVMGLVSVCWLALNLSGLFSGRIEDWAKRSFLSSLIVMLVMSLAIGFR